MERKLTPVMLVTFGGVFLWIALGTVGSRIRIQLDGVVISSRDVPPSRPPRYATEYVLRGPDGRNTNYIAGASDADLPRSMPVGTYIRKQRWQLFYERNGRRVDDFSIPFYASILGIAFGFFVWSLVLWHQQTKQPQ